MFNRNSRSIWPSLLNECRMLADIVQSHVNTKRKIDAMKRGLTIKRAQTRLITISRHVQTHFQHETSWDAVRKILKRVWTQFLYTTCWNAIRKKTNRISTRFWKIFSAFKRILFTNYVQAHLKYLFSRIETHSYFRAHFYRFISCVSDAILSKNCCSRRINCLIEIIVWNIFYSSKLY